MNVGEKIYKKKELKESDRERYGEKEEERLELRQSRNDEMTER